MCGVLYKNLNNLRKLYSNYMFKPKKDFRSGSSFSVISAVQMLRKSQISIDDISDKEIAVLFGVSKMTIIDEMGERNKYFNLEFVEFLEFICRVADFMYNPQG